MASADILRDRFSVTAEVTHWIGARAHQNAWVHFSHFSPKERAQNMKYLVTALIAAYILTGALQLHSRDREPITTVVPRRRIEQTLSQRLPEATNEFGGGLFDGINYRIGALRRTTAGEVEVHQNDTDILYVISGAATLITGGEVIGRREISAVEARGTSIRNGLQHELRAGDVVVIPRRQPHWFQKVSGEISYVVTKVQ